MSNTIRKIKDKEFRDGEIFNLTKDKTPKKSFVYRGDGWTTKSKGGPGNKRGWKQPIPKWLFKKYKEKAYE